MTIEHKNENKASETLLKHFFGEISNLDDAFKKLTPLQINIVYEEGMVGNEKTIVEQSPVAKTVRECRRYWDKAMFMFSQTFWKSVDQAPDLIPCKPEEIVEMDTLLEEQDSYEFDVDDKKKSKKKK